MASERRPFRVPVTALIVTLILAVAAPSLAFSALLLLQSDNINRNGLAVRARQGVSVIADRLEREFQSMSTNLALLSASGWIDRQEYDRLHARAAQALAGTNTYFVAVDGENNQMLNTRVPWGTPLPPVGDPEVVKQATDTGQLVISNVFVGRVAQQPVFDVVMPIISGEYRVKALILTRNAKSLASIFKDDAPPPGWSFAVLDGQGHLAAGAAPPGEHPELLGQLCSADTPILHQEKSGKVEYASASEKLPHWGWRACVWTASDQINAPNAQRWRTFTLITLSIVAATIIAGGALGQLLAQAIRRAATVGRALEGDGDVPERHSVIREVDDVLGALTRQARRRKTYEQELKVLMSETAHRAKNQLQIGTALVRLSARSATSIEQLRDDIAARLGALGRSIDMMSINPSGAVPLKGFIEKQLEPFAGSQPGRLELQGPSTFIPPATAQSLGLALHEFATNAAKYGGWSTPEGRVQIDWREGEEGLVLTWTERGGPAPSAPTRTGFGSSLIEMMIDRNLGGSVTRDFRTTGLQAVITLPRGAGDL